MSLGSEWSNRNFSSNGGTVVMTSQGGGGGSLNAANATTAVSRKIPLADYRYGKEEMISLFSDPPSYPPDISNISVVVRQNCVQPLAFVPLTEVEQVALTGNVNSGSVYSSRGRGGFYRGGGGRGRGRGGRTDYHRSTSGGEEFSDRGGYYRSNSDSTWTEEGRGGYQTKGGRALRDSNWRSTRPLGEVSEGQGGKGGKGSGNNERKEHWNPMPEWATEDPKKSVGAFDGKGKFSTSDQDADTSDNGGDQDDKRNEEEEDDERRRDGEDKRSDSESPEDVFEETENKDRHNMPIDGQLDEFTDQEDRNEDWPPAPPQPQPKVKENRVQSVDSVEEMQRRFEKAAEAVLSTEDEDTPSPSPNLVSTQQPHPQPQQLPIRPPNSSNMDDMQRWLYKDPRGELQGPFTNQEMSDWFAAGYFTMDLNVRRVCDAMFLPLGQIIRIWGRIPFAAGPQPPPLQQTEPFWQQMFSHQQQLFPQGHQNSTVSQQSSSLPSVVSTPASTAVNSDTSPIWGLLPTRMSPEEEQWPDLTGGSDPPQSMPLVADTVTTQGLSSSSGQEGMEEVFRQKMKLIEDEEERRKAAELKLEEEIARKIEEDRRREEERKKKEEEELMLRRKREEEQRQKAMEEEKRKRKQKEEEDRLRREKERERLEMERKREWEEELQRRKMQQQQREEEERRISEELRIQQQKQSDTVQQLSKGSSEPSFGDMGGDSGAGVWMYEQSNPLAPSLLQIQQEEKKREKIRSEERRQQLILQQHQLQQEQQQQAGISWNSPTTPHNKPLSFLEIQQEQEKQFSVRGRGGGGTGESVTTGGIVSGGTKLTAPPVQSSWSKIAASSKSSTLQSTTPHWGSSYQPQSNPTPPVHQPSPRKENQPLSFWEECAAIETTMTTVGSSSGSNSSTRSGSNSSSGKSTGRGKNKDENGGKSSSKGATKKKEEEKVRQLFSYNSTDDPFTAWCAAELVKFNTDVDAATFVSLLLEVESTYEVHDYIKSFLGETDEVHSFAKQFLERRQKLKNYGQQQQQKKSGNSSSSYESSAATGSSTSSSSTSSRSAKKKKKGKMQKMAASAVLGFTVNAAERPNAGEIHSVKDAL